MAGIVYNRFHKLLLTALLCLLAGFVFSQSSKNIELEVVRHEFLDSANMIQFFVKATEDGRNLTNESLNEFAFYDHFQGENPERLKVFAIDERDSLSEAGEIDEEKFYVLFLVGLDRQETPSFQDARSALIDEFADKIQLPGATEFYLSAYGNRVHLPKPVNLEEVNKRLDGHPDNQEYAELHDALIEATRFLRKKGKGRKVILLLTDGFDHPNPEYYDPSNRLPYNKEDIQAVLGRMDDNFMVFPLGMGSQPDSSFFQLVNDATANASDTHSFGDQIPTNLTDLLFAERSYIYNKVIRVGPNQQHVVYKGEKRSVELNWKGTTYNYDMSDIGTPTNPDYRLTPDDFKSPTDWLKGFFLGLAIVVGSLFLMWWFVPWNKRRTFKQQYIVPYSEESGVRKRDPLSGEVFQPGELVVVKCPHTTTSVPTWEYVGNKCPQYPRCLNFATPCEGHGAPIAEDNFFSMKGAFRRLNWLWYGMVGGMLAWSILAIIHVFFYGAFNSFVTDFIGSDRELKNLIMVGMSLGTGISATLSFIEEKSQPRRFSWVRVFVRTFAGMVMSMLIFLAGFYLQSQGYISNDYVAGILTWLLFGVAIGVVMSVESSIATMRGIMGGVLAAIVGYAMYLFFLNNVFVNNFPLAKLLSLLTLGAILGGILVTVVSRLEDFELEYLSPEQFRQTKPISKWLKQNLDVVIGTETGSYVYVKWQDDAVQPRHARLHYNKRAVFIEPLAETLVNGRIITLNKSTHLKDGDLIQLGRDSETRMRFKEKRSTKQDAPSPYADKLAGQASASPTSGKKGKIIIKGKG